MRPASLELITRVLPRHAFARRSLTRKVVPRRTKGGWKIGSGLSFRDEELHGEYVMAARVYPPPRIRRVQVFASACTSFTRGSFYSAKFPPSSRKDVPPLSLFPVWLVVLTLMKFSRMSFRLFPFFSSRLRSLRREKKRRVKNLHRVSSPVAVFRAFKFW